MLDPITIETLELFSRRRRRLILLRSVSIATLAFLLAMSLVALCDYLWLLPGLVRIALSLVAYAITAFSLWALGLRYLRHQNTLRAARQLQAVEPRVHDDLLSAVEFSDRQNINGSVELHDRLQSMVARRLLTLDIPKALPIDLVRRWLIASVVLGVGCLLLLLIPSLQFGRRLARAAMPIAAIERASLTRVTIIEPSPVTRFVPKGDTIAVIVDLAGKPADQVTLEYQSDGVLASKQMIERQLESSTVYSANLEMGDHPIDYRVVAGDAVTLWYTLTPIGRPSTKLFQWRYEFPAYTGLPDVCEQSTEGHLNALKGTNAHLMVHFDQAVRDVLVVYKNDDRSLALQPADSSNMAFTGIVPIESAAEYHIDAVGIETELNNPFGPRYAITPVLDSAPIVRLDKDPQQSELVSPLETITIDGSVQDDLPIDHVFYEVSVNGSEAVVGAIGEVAISVDSLPASQFFISKTIDLLRLASEHESGHSKLSHGDVVRIRLAAIDRHNQKGTSHWRQLFVVDETFDRSRHTLLDAMHSIAVQTIDWVEKSTEQNGGQPAQKEELLQNLTSTLARLSSPSNVINVEQMGRAIIRSDSTKQLEQLSGFAWAITNHHLTSAVMADVTAICESLEPIVTGQIDLPLPLFERYYRLAIVRLSAIDRLIRKYDIVLSNSQRRPFEEWMRFSESWQIRLDNALQDPPGEENLRELMSRFANDLKQIRNNGLLKDQLASDLYRRTDRLNHQARLEFKSIRKEVGNKFFFKQWLNQLEQYESMHRIGSNVDLDYASDLDLLAKAIAFIESDPFREAFDIEPRVAMRELLAAGEVLESAHEAVQIKRELFELISSESQMGSARDLRQSDAVTYAKARVEHPYWFERIDRGIDLQSSEAIKQVRRLPGFRRAAEQINERRWRGENYQPIDSLLRDVFVEWNAAIKINEPKVIEARQIIRRYVPSLVEQARQAEQKAAAAKERVRDREDTSQATAQKLAQQQQIAADAAAETMQRLADLANTADLADPHEQQLARDADDAAAQIGRSLQQAETSMRKATISPSEQDRRENLDRTADALKTLEESLRLTADHFERAEKGQDLTESRNELAKARALADDAQKETEAMANGFDQAAQLSKVGNSSPEELLKRLEVELKRNEPMQQALVKIASDTTQTAINDLLDAAKKQKELNNRIETSDPEIREQKKRQSQLFEGLVRQTTAVQGAILNRAHRTAAMANQTEVRNEISELERALQAISQSIRDTNREDRLMSEINQSARQTQQQFAEVLTRIANIEKALIEAAQKDRVANEVERKRLTSDARQAQIESRNQLSRELLNQANWWSDNAEEASRRISEAQRQTSGTGEQVERSRRTEAAARASKVFAQQQQLLADRQRGIVERLRIEPLEQPNPAAEAAAVLMRQAGEAISLIGDRIASMVEQTQQAEAINPSRQSLELAHQTQVEITNQTALVVDQLARTKRHQQRLGDHQLAEQFRQATEAVKENAVESSKQSENVIEGILQQSQQSDDRDQPILTQIAKASNAIEAEAQQLSRAFRAEIGRSQPEPTTANQQEQQRQAMQLARTLDELDRVVFPGEIPNRQDAGQASKGNGDSQQGSSKSAADVSPTLASEMNQQMQSIAMKRQEQIVSSTMSSLSNQRQPSPNAVRSQSAPSAMASAAESKGGVLEVEGVERLGESDWGQLRLRGREDAAEASRTGTSPRYQTQIEAYFEAVARQSTRSKE
ncbi:hypothetical protein Q31b_07560 [Novipirellula aureliae]|uniref:Uncharacterized protein n=1 Tax=Novipirellula aureliae TaxID=2527966 RepID=A0A5C6ECZ5_9BACT|nr:hypothetical protein [Novipirellula aureliae]TWU45581.1 hypothetical protein Q31b_07560 [Novipirellula aureliae]